jgi:chromosome segregation ATPase
MRAEQAELDARLAEAQVLTQKSEEQLQRAQTRIKRLRKQLEVQPMSRQSLGRAALLALVGLQGCASQRSERRLMSQRPSRRSRKIPMCCASRRGRDPRR